MVVAELEGRNVVHFALNIVLILIRVTIHNITHTTVQGVLTLKTGLQSRYVIPKAVKC